MSINRKLQSAIRLALNVSAGAGALAIAFTPNAFAQDAASDSDKTELPRLEIEETVVTGSRIKRADIDSASPVTVLDRADMQLTGMLDVGDFLQRMPSMSGSPIGTTTNNGGNGSVLIDLRGLGTDRTLTLVNGQRIVDGGDFQTIPSTMVERIEVLKDGSSAVYGADAVAGVVNIITRRNFEGVEFSAQTADWFDSAGKQNQFGVIAGTEFERGNFVFGAEYIDQDEAFQQDVPWAFMQDSFYIYPEGCERQVAAPYDGTPSGGCYPLGSSSIPETRFTLFGFHIPGDPRVDSDGNPDNSRLLIGTPQAGPNLAGTPILHDERNYNYAPVNYLQTPYQRYNIFSEGHFEVTDNVRFNAEFRGNYRKSAQELAPTPLFTDVGDPAFDGFFDSDGDGDLDPFHGVSQDNFYLRQAITNFNAANGTDVPFVPAVGIRRRMFEQPRRFTQEIQQWQFVAGLEGKIQDVDWNIYVNYGARNRSDQDFGQYSGPLLAQALGPSADLIGSDGGPGSDGIPECYGDINDPRTLIVGCVPLNVFGGGEVVRATGEPVVSTVTQEMLDAITFTLNDSFSTRNTSVGASASGSLFELPGGELGWAAGWAYWKQEFRFTPDSGKSANAVTGNASTPTNGDLINNGVFLEVLAPVYDNGSQAVTLKGGLRYDDWDQFEGDETWQLGVELQVVEDLKLRGTAGTIFRAPTINDLFQGTLDSFPTFTDPCDPTSGPIAAGCNGQNAPAGENQVLSKVGGNPNLQPETGDTITAGVVWTPSIGEHSFTATVDYWKIDLDDAISSLGVQFYLDDCYINLNQASCEVITRRPFDFGIEQIVDDLLNVATQGAEGVDTEIRWDYSSSIGQWQASVLWSHLIERSKVPFAGAEEQRLDGRFTDPTAQDGGAYAEDKANFTLQWALGDLSIGYLAEYISSLDADTFCNCGEGNRPDGTYIQDIHAELYSDVVVSYELGGLGLTLSGGVTNITDEAPPFIEEGFNATTDPSTYRLFGIGYYLRAAWKF